MTLRNSRTLPVQGRAQLVEDSAFELRVGCVPTAGLSQEVRSQCRDILTALAEWGDIDLEDAQAEEQVFAELAGRHQRVERPVGGGNDADVGGAAVARRRPA